MKKLPCVVEQVGGTVETSGELIRQSPSDTGYVEACGLIRSSSY